MAGIGNIEADMESMSIVRERRYIDEGPGDMSVQNLPVKAPRRNAQNLTHVVDIVPHVRLVYDWEDVKVHIANNDYENLPGPLSTKGPGDKAVDVQLVIVPEGDGLVTVVKHLIMKDRVNHAEISAVAHGAWKCLDYAAGVADSSHISHWQFWSNMEGSLMSRSGGHIRDMFFSRRVQNCAHLPVFFDAHSQDSLASTSSSRCVQNSAHLPVFFADHSQDSLASTSMCHCDVRTCQFSLLTTHRIHWLQHRGVIVQSPKLSSRMGVLILLAIQCVHACRAETGHTSTVCLRTEVCLKPSHLCV